MDNYRYEEYDDASKLAPYNSSRCTKYSYSAHDSDSNKNNHGCGAVFYRTSSSSIPLATPDVAKATSHTRWQGKVDNFLKLHRQLLQVMSCT